MEEQGRGTEITAQRTEEFGLPPQQEGESDHAFRYRVAGALRERGRIIEAHEAFNNALYNDSEEAMTGIIGAVAQAMLGRDYGAGTGERQVDDDFAAGTVAQAPKEDDKLLARLLLSGLMK